MTNAAWWFKDKLYQELYRETPDNAFGQSRCGQVQALTLADLAMLIPILSRQQW